MLLDAKNVIIVSLTSFCTLLLVATIYFYATPKTEVRTETVKVPVVKINYEPSLVKEWLLRVGVADAWVSVDSVSKKKADCFSTILLSNGSVFSYCELRK